MPKFLFYVSEDTPLGETKLGDLPKWLSRRNYSPTAMGRCVSRAYWRWQHKYMQPRYAGLTPAIQVSPRMLGQLLIFQRPAPVLKLYCHQGRLVAAPLFGASRKGLTRKVCQIYYSLLGKSPQKPPAPINHHSINIF